VSKSSIINNSVEKVLAYKNVSNKYKERESGIYQDIYPNCEKKACGPVFENLLY
jgi:hypothetical protein